MQENHQAFAHEYVRAFAQRALHDALELDQYRMRMLEDEGGWAVDVDIPTAALPCWLSFHVRETDAGPAATFDLAIRSGSGSDVASVYAWDEARGTWQLESS